MLEHASPTADTAQHMHMAYICPATHLHTMLNVAYLIAAAAAIHSRPVYKSRQKLDSVRNVFDTSALDDNAAITLKIYIHTFNILHSFYQIRMKQRDRETLHINLCVNIPSSYHCDHVRAYFPVAAATQNLHI